MRALLLITFSTVVLAACAPGSVLELRQEPAAKRTFEVERNYQAVYRAIVEQARKCYQGNVLLSTMLVQGDLYNDLKSGHVSVAMHNALGQVDTYMAADVVAIGESRSKVDVYAGMRSWAPITVGVEEWVKEGSTTCGAKAG